MSRRRYLSTEISVDRQVNQLGTKYGDAPVLLYTWMIPHAADDGTINGDPYELLGMVWPQRRDKSEEDVIRCLTQIEEFGLIAWDRDAALIYFPAGPFYRYQSYIKESNRRKTDPLPRDPEQRKTAENSGKNISPPTSAEISGDQRRSAENAVSFSLSDPPPHSLRPSPGSPSQSSGDPGEGAAVPSAAPPSLPLALAIQWWNTSAQSAGLPLVQQVTETRRKHWNARAAPERTAQWWQAYFAQIAAIPFCRGDNDRQWRATFDWAIRSEDVIARVHEGVYDARKEPKHGHSHTARIDARWLDTDDPLDSLVQGRGP